MTKEQFIGYIQHPELLNENSVAELKEMINEYPFFAVARILYLLNLKLINSYKFEVELAKNAIFIPDRKVLFNILNKKINSEKFELLPFDANVFRDEAISDEMETLPSFVFDYPQPFDLLDNFDKEKDDVQPVEIDLIDKFIIENPSMIGKRKIKTEPKPNQTSDADQLNDSLITETLAQIYVTQKLYDDALKAYEKLSLKFPEKNSYFATQIEIIKKLISKDL